MKEDNIIYLIGYACDLAGAYAGSREGPQLLQQSPFLNSLTKKGIKLHWEQLITPMDSSLSTLDNTHLLCTMLATITYELTKQRKFFITFGGDHSCAIGTWSGTSAALSSNEALGLIWIDAHMDSHTPDTSLSGNIHGMPVASLLGHGHKKLTQIIHKHPKLKPENICLIGVRCFEEGEAALLNHLNVRVFFMEEVQQRGIEAVMKEALTIVKKNTAYFGVSLDIDGLDPNDAPGTGINEPDGISKEDIYRAVQMLTKENQLIALEIAEFDPHRDMDHKTEIIIAKIVEMISLGKKND